MSQYEDAMAALGRLGEVIDDTVQALRNVDKLAPSQVRHFNGAVDDTHANFAKLQPTRERLLQRTQSGEPDLEIARGMDGLRA